MAKSIDAGKAPATDASWKKDTTLAAKYEVCRATIWNWADRGILEKRKFGGATRFSDQPIRDGPGK